MQKPEVKGLMFIETYNFIQKKWGSEGLKKFGLDPGTHRSEVWYPFEEFCELLERTVRHSGKGEMLPYHIGIWTVVVDPRWNGVFAGKDPKEVLGGTKHQSKVYRVGDVKDTVVEDGRIRIFYDLWNRDPAHTEVWSEFYRGRLKGILDLTGKKGEVQKSIDPLSAQRTITYDIRWQLR